MFRFQDSRPRRDEELEAAAAQREVTVTFNADVTDGMPWRFVPAQRSVKARAVSPHPTNFLLTLHLNALLSDVWIPFTDV